MITVSNICAVVVTYSDRRFFLKQVISYLLQKNIFKIVIVLNGVTWKFEDERFLLNDKFEFVILEKNYGPAVGCKIGIERAVSFKCNMIWILDDDNVPNENCIETMIDCYNDFIFHCSNLRIALTPFRPTYQSMTGSFARNRLIPPRSSFVGFHFSQILSRIFNFDRSQDSSINREELVSLMSAPYGGLLFDKSILSEIGYPREDFILYADDTEWTYRFVSKGGNLILVKNAILNDVDCSWDNNVYYMFYIWLEGLSDLKCYYRMRNLVYFFKHIYADSEYIYLINKYVYLFSMFFMSVFRCKLKRFNLILGAIADGERGQLGLNQKYKL